MHMNKLSKLKALEDLPLSSLIQLLLEIVRLGNDMKEYFPNTIFSTWGRSRNNNLNKNNNQKEWNLYSP